MFEYCNISTIFNKHYSIDVQKWESKKQAAVHEITLIYLKKVGTKSKVNTTLINVLIN